MAPVTRELELPPISHYQQPNTGAPATRFIDNLPANFSGHLTMYPEYLVGVSVKLNDNETEAASARFGQKTMVPLNCEIRLQARESDYACVECIQRRLRDLITLPSHCLPRIVRIVDWDEVSESVSKIFGEVNAVQRPLTRQTSSLVERVEVFPQPTPSV